MNTQYAEIRNGKLIIGYSGRTAYPIGIRQARKDLAQIENSELDLKPSTIERRDILRKGIALWEAQSK
jgi:hypothetical protein